MSDVAIQIENLGKRYRYGGPATASYNLRQDLTDWARGLWARRSQQSAVSSQNPLVTIHTPPSIPAHHASFHEVHEKHLVEDPNFFWALRNINLEVKQGEVVGIIGRNGAGKSTLLKILSRITPPTTGSITYNGRIASLLEVGTGFHRELTGRENIYLNGSILGMKRAEIANIFDEIVSFAEVDKFIDTPVKFYSSGMYVRLAFAVAAHLEPEILVVDEVLAVGDAEFQKKCMGKMEDVAKQGRTILFVSHNMAAILSLCSRGYFLDQGQVLCVGKVQEVVDRYLKNATKISTIPLDQRLDRKGDGKVRLTSLTIASGNGKAVVRCSDSLRITLGYTADKELRSAAFLVGIYDQFNRPIFFLDSRAAGNLPEVLPPSGAIVCRTGPINLTEGECSVNVAILVGNEIVDHVTNAYTLDVASEDFYGTGKLTQRQTALCLIRQDWQLEETRR